MKRTSLRCAELNRLSASLESSSITARESRRRQDLISGLRRKAEELSGALSEVAKPRGAGGMGSIDIQDDGDTRETEATVDLTTAASSSFSET